MTTTNFARSTAAVLGLGLGMAATSADAQIYKSGDLAVTGTIGATTDYVFRGVSQSNSEPAFQASLDATYKMFYIGAWGSHIDFGGTPAVGGFAEIDLYAGIKPTWGPVTFDFGVIYYVYPGARDKTAEADYVELKAGASIAIQKLTVGGVVYYSPEYTLKQDEVVTLEGTIAYELPSFRGITPTLSALLGSSIGDAGKGFTQANGDDSYLYWNAGVAFAFDKLTVDLRYWDTNIENNKSSTNFCTNKLFGCDERFVASAKITF